MSIKFKSILEDQFRSMHLGNNEQDPLLLSSDVPHGIIPCDEQSSPTLGSTASKLTRFIKEAFVDGDDEEIRPLMDFDELEVELTSREIVDLNITAIDRSAIFGISIKDLEVLKQRYPNIREAVFSRINREAKEVFDLSSWLYLEKLSFKYFDLTEKELKILSKSRWITHLDLACSQKKINSSEWAHIGSLKNLESLAIRRCLSADKQVVDVLKSCKKIRHLKLTDCQGISSDIVKKISSFTQLVSLQVHLLDESEQSTLESLERLSNLEDLELSGNWSNIQSLGCLTNLKRLSLHEFNITDAQLTEVISRLPRLERLTLSKSDTLTSRAIASIGEHLRRLNYLNLNHCTNIKDLTPLAFLTRLKHLNLSACLGIKDLSVLKSLGELEYLNLKGLWLLDCSPIAFLDNLKYLNLSFCDIEDITFLKNLQQLEYLNVIQSFHKKALDLKLVPMNSDNFKQLVVSQDDKILGRRKLDDHLQQKIKQELIPSHWREYI